MSPPSAYNPIKGCTAGYGCSCGGRCAGKCGARVGENPSAVSHVSGGRHGEISRDRDKALRPAPAPCFLQGWCPADLTRLTQQLEPQPSCCPLCPGFLSLPASFLIVCVSDVTVPTPRASDTAIADIRPFSLCFSLKWKGKPVLSLLAPGGPLLSLNMQNKCCCNLTHPSWWGKLWIAVVPVQISSPKSSIKVAAGGGLISVVAPEETSQSTEQIWFRLLVWRHILWAPAMWVIDLWPIHLPVFPGLGRKKVLFQSLYFNTIKILDGLSS